MVMTVYGENPDSEKGGVFYSAIWSWAPLWSIVNEIGPDLSAKVNSPYDNNGDGLDKEDSVELARRIGRVLDSGKAKEVFDRGIDKLNQQTPESERRNYFALAYNENPDEIVDDLAEFRDFLANCGGFRIC